MKNIKEICMRAINDPFESINEVTSLLRLFINTEEISEVHFHLEYRC